MCGSRVREGAWVRCTLSSRDPPRVLQRPRGSGLAGPASFVATEFPQTPHPRPASAGKVRLQVFFWPVPRGSRLPGPRSLGLSPRRAPAPPAASTATARKRSRVPPSGWRMVTPEAGPRLPHPAARPDGLWAGREPAASAFLLPAGVYRI